MELIISLIFTIVCNEKLLSTFGMPGCSFEDLNVSCAINVHHQNDKNIYIL